MLSVGKFLKKMDNVVLKKVDFLSRKDKEIFNHLNVKENSTFVVKLKFDLSNKTITLPENSILSFQDNGIITNGTIIGNNSTIIANKKVFNNVVLKGTWNCVGEVKWWANGVKDVNNLTNDYEGLQNALDSSFTELVFSPVKYYTSNTLVLTSPKNLVLKGISMRFPLSWHKNIENTTIIFTDLNIDLLDINIKDNEKYNTVEVNGGNFDVSLCANYTRSCIRVTSDMGGDYRINDPGYDRERITKLKIWGLKINTTLNGNYSSVHEKVWESYPLKLSNGIECGVGIYINPTINNLLNDNSTFITNVYVNSNIHFFGIGIKGRGSVNWKDDTYSNWCTDLYLDGNIVDCPLAIDTDIDSDIHTSILTAKFFTLVNPNPDNWGVYRPTNDLAVIRFSGKKCYITSAIHDVYTGDTNKGSNRYLLEHAYPYYRDNNGNLISIANKCSLLTSGMFKLLCEDLVNHAPLHPEMIKTVLTGDYWNGTSQVRGESSSSYYDSI